MIYKHPSSYLTQSLQVIEINLRLPPPRLDLGLGMDGGTALEDMWRRPALAGHEPPVVFKKEVAEGDLDLIGSEKAARAGMLAMAEEQVPRGCSYELPAVSLVGLLALAQEPRGIEALRIWVQVRIVQGGACHLNAGALWQNRSVGELDILFDISLQ